MPLVWWWVFEGFGGFIVFNGVIVLWKWSIIWLWKLDLWIWAISYKYGSFWCESNVKKPQSNPKARHLYFQEFNFQILVRTLRIGKTLLLTLRSVRKQPYQCFLIMPFTQWASEHQNLRRTVLDPLLCHFHIRFGVNVFAQINKNLLTMLVDKKLTYHSDRL